MSGKGANQQEQVPCPQCGKRVQRRNLKKHQRSQHDGVRRRRHACPFCKPEVCKTYSTFQDWKNHLHTTHDQCVEDDDPMDREEYAAGFKLDRWERFHHIQGDETDRAYQRIATLRKHYGQYRGKVQGEPPGTPSTIRIPHTKGTTPDREVAPTESEFAGREQEGSDQEEGEITQTEGDGSGAFMQMRPRDSDSGSDDTTPGRESWRSARGQELVVLSMPRPRGRGKRRPERREGAAKRSRVESSSSDRRDGSEESRSGGGRDRPGRCSQRAAGPSTPPRRPIPASVSPRRKPYDPSGSGQSPRRHQQEEPSRRKWWPRPATPLSRKGTQPPHPCGPRAAGAQQRTSQQGWERPESWQNLLPPSGSWHRRPDHRGTDP